MSESLKFIRKKIDSRSPVEDIEFQPEQPSKPEKKPEKKLQDRYLDFLESIYSDVLSARLDKE